MIDLIEKAASTGRELWRARWLGLYVAWGIAALFVALVLVMKDRYEATARIYIDTQTVLKPLMAGMAVQPDVEQQIRMLARTLISRPNVERLRASETIGWDKMDKAAQERDIEPLMTGIKVTPSGGGNIYSISYRDTDPGRAVRLVDTLVTVFVSSSGSDKRKDSEDARNFIDQQIAAHETKLAAAENALKDFKLKNFGIAGVSNQDYFSRVSALQDDVNRVRLELSAAEQSRDALRRELQNESPRVMSDLPNGISGLPPAEVDVRLEAQRKQLDELLRRYTDEHPDVVNTRRTIAQIEAQRRAEHEARARVEAGKPPAAGNNPVFQQLRISLAAAEANVASLRMRLGVQQSRLDEVRSQASRVPQVEAELAQLNRDYEVIRKNYDQLVSRRESASLGVKIDQSMPIADFRIVDPPRTARMPVMPNRIAVALLGLIAALAGGIGAAWLYVRLRPTIVAANQLRQVSGRPVVGSVSLQVGREQVERMRSSGRHLMLGGAGLLAIQLAWLAWVALNSRL